MILCECARPRARLYIQSCFLFGPIQVRARNKAGGKGGLFNKRRLYWRERRRKKSQIELRVEIIATLSLALCHREK